MNAGADGHYLAGGAPPQLGHCSRIAGEDPRFPRFASSPPPGGVTAWYTMRLTALAEDREDAFDMDVTTALREYEQRDALRCAAWRGKFTQAGGEG